MIKVSEAYKVIDSFENPLNKQNEFSNKENFHVKNNLIEYHNQKEHWLAWLDSKAPTADFKDVYVYIRCAPMLSYLADGLGLDTDDFVNYIQGIKGINNSNSVVEARLFRKAFPYNVIEEAMSKKL